MKKSNNFEQILILIKNLDSFAGNFVFRRKKKEKKRWIQIFGVKLPIFLTNISIQIITTLILSKFNLISIIISSACSSAAIALLYNILKLKIKNSEVHHFINWCESLHNIEKKFHPSIQTFALSHFDKMTNQSTKIIKFVAIILTTNCILMTFGFAFIGLFLPESICEKYSLPMPFVFPFDHRRTWWTFFLAVTGQASAILDFACLELLLFGILLTIIMHITTYLDVIKEMIHLMKIDIDSKCILNDVKNPDQISKRRGKLDRKLLSTIMESIESEPEIIKAQPKFDDFIKIVVEMICDVNHIIFELSKFFSGPFLFAEITCLGSLFMAGMIFLVIHQQYFFGIGVVYVPTLFLMICLANEHILEKINGVKEELYNIPWNELPPKQRTKLLIAMKCDHIQQGFNAGKFHKLTNERFAQLLNLAYTNSLVLKDLIKK